MPSQLNEMAFSVPLPSGGDKGVGF